MPLFPLLIKPPPPPLLPLLLLLLIRTLRSGGGARSIDAIDGISSSKTLIVAFERDRNDDTCHRSFPAAAALVRQLLCGCGSHAFLLSRHLQPGLTLLQSGQHIGFRRFVETFAASASLVRALVDDFNRAAMRGSTKALAGPDSSLLGRSVPSDSARVSPFRCRPLMDEDELPPLLWDLSEALSSSSSALAVVLPFSAIWSLFPDLGEGTATAPLYLLGLDSVGTSSCLRLPLSIQAGCTASRPRPKEGDDAEDDRGVVKLLRGGSSSSLFTRDGLESVEIFLGGYGSRSRRLSLKSSATSCVSPSVLASKEGAGLRPIVKWGSAARGERSVKWILSWEETPRFLTAVIKQSAFLVKSFPRAAGLDILSSSFRNEVDAGKGFVVAVNVCADVVVGPPIPRWCCAVVRWFDDEDSGIPLAFFGRLVLAPCALGVGSLEEITSRMLDFFAIGLLLTILSNWLLELLGCLLRWYLTDESGFSSLFSLDPRSIESAALSAADEDGAFADNSFGTSNFSFSALPLSVIGFEDSTFTGVESKNIDVAGRIVSADNIFSGDEDVFFFLRLLLLLADFPEVLSGTELLSSSWSFFFFFFAYAARFLLILTTITSSSLSTEFSNDSSDRSNVSPFWFTCDDDDEEEDDEDERESSTILFAIPLADGRARGSFLSTPPLLLSLPSS